MTKGSYLADLVTVIGTQDLVFEKLIDKKNVKLKKKIV